MIRPKKSLGQNFLRDENILRRIAESVGATANDLVVEIGPGTGALTKALTVIGCKLTVIEVDQRAVAVLTQQFGGRIRILEADVLDVDVTSLGSDLTIVGNIPYYITSDILFWVFNGHKVVKTATLMMQAEVAERLVAKPRTKAYGILTVFADYYATTTALFNVPRTAFYPKPTVDSTVVRLELKKNLPLKEELLFRNVVRTAFGQRRKTLKNALGRLGLTAEQFASLNFDLTRRAEELTVADFIQLTNLILPFRSSVTLPFKL